MRPCRTPSWLESHIRTGFHCQPIRRAFHPLLIVLNDDLDKNRESMLFKYEDDTKVCEKLICKI